jgi:hypothetical protein
MPRVAPVMAQDTIFNLSIEMLSVWAILCLVQYEGVNSIRSVVVVIN